MYSISNAIVAPPTLPARYLSQDYDKFLFFEFDLRSDQIFFDELQKTAAANTEICIFYSQTLAFLGQTFGDERWSEKIKSIIKDLATQDEYFGVIVAERTGAWILAQDTPVNWGVFGLKSSNANALKLYHANDTSRDWFVSLEHFKQAILDPNSSMRLSVGIDFMRAIISDYGTEYPNSIFSAH